MELGTKVVHRIYGFKGEVIEIDTLANQCKIQITEGHNPMSAESDTYIASMDMVQEEKSFEKDYAEFEKNMDSILSQLFTNILEDIESKEEPEEVKEDDFVIEFEMEGAVIRFKSYEDFKQFTNDMR